LTLHEVTLSDGSSLVTEDELLMLAASAEANSDHKIAAAISEAARLKNISLSRASDFAVLGGVGVQAKIDGRQVAVGGPSLLNRLGIQVTYNDLLKASESNENGFTAVFVIVDSVLCGQIHLKDEINDGAADAVRVLSSRGIDVAMITGDATGVANYVAKQVGIDRVFAEVQPARKVGIVKELQADGSKIAFVGDGIEDAATLVQADLGLAFGGGSDIALQSAGLVLINADPMAIPRTFLLAKRSLTKRRQNLVLCVALSTASLFFASGVFASVGLVVSPVAAVVLVSLSTVIVAVNGQLLRR
jgi:Cu2+-exporting ATPase